MQSQSQCDISEEAIREEHLRFAVLLDRLTDAWNDSQPVRNHIAELRLEFDSHAAIEEQVLEERASSALERHRAGHDAMSSLLSRLAGEYEGGTDIRGTLEEIQALFTQRIIPDDQIFLTT